MLKQRLLTALILIPVFVLALLKLNPHQFALLTVVFVMLGAWEWSSLMGLTGWFRRLCYVVLVFCALPLSLKFDTPTLLLYAFYWWCLAFVLVLLYPHASILWNKTIIQRMLMGLCVLIPTWRALNFIRDNVLFDQQLAGTYLLLFLFVLIWGADSGAYFAGKKWGKHKLAPQVSPGKTWQGLAGALMTSLIIAAIGIFLGLFKQVPYVWIVVLCVATTVFSVLGDLFESMLKRNVGLKDSGQLFPGHGGLLDRIDSLTAAAPIFALCCIWISKNFY
jgi:phosphatidate cytidylyltransferase